MAGEGAKGPVLRVQAGGVEAELRFPIRVTVQGIEAVLVLASAPEARPPALKLPRRTRPSGIDQDPAVRSYIDELMSDKDEPTILRLVRAKFGAQRTPSRSALNRYTVRERTKAEAARLANEREVKRARS